MNPYHGKEEELSKRRIQDVLPLAFLAMKCSGVWQPYDSGSVLSVIYAMYMIFAVFSMVTITLSLFCVSLFSSENIKESLLENSFLLLTLFNAWVKAAVLLTRRKNIELLLNILLKSYCQPSDSVEVNIQREYDQEARQVTRNYAILIGCSIMVLYFPIVFEHGDERIRMLNVWRPYDLRVSFYFWNTYVHEILGHIVTSCMHLSADTLISGLIMQLSCQIQFLCHRLSKLSTLSEKFILPKNLIRTKKLELESSLISQIITHHNTLDTLTAEINHVFAEVLFCQFCLSLFVICLCIYKIVSVEKLDSNTMLVVTYTCCMLVQLYIFCWYGNELMLNSVKLNEAILETNWPFLEQKSKQSLILLMIRSSKPFQISTGALIFVHLETFMSILKASYSAYNLLQHSM